MPPRRKSALEDLIRQGLVADGELLRYKVRRAGQHRLLFPCCLRRRRCLYQAGQEGLANLQ